ncbi:AAA family ATPase [Jatrophihabitans endophyticus]|uniref:AAA family ATPase n=1 Tax=Jatrophihabitans endophyticus TaxID=1206085 RepID=UPI0026EA3F9A|nr:AAA family ATPase [Jatrophihabitans endophyticus]
MPARLVVLNGPPASGKSTIAQRYLDEHPGALSLDLDRFRRFVGGWRDDPLDAHHLTTDFALAAAAAHLRAGHDVVVPQYFGRVDRLARLDELADQTGAVPDEFVLFGTRDAMVARFAARTAAAADPTHLEAQDLLDAAGGVRQLEAMYDRLLLVIAARPRAQLVPAPEGEIDATYRAVLDRLTALSP